MKGLLRGGRFWLIIFIAFGFLFLHLFISSKKLQRVSYIRDPIPKVDIHQLLCRKEMERFWNTPVSKFKFRNVNTSCIYSNSSDGSFKHGLKDLIVPQNFQHLPECKPVIVDYYRTPHPLTALASFPGSGNTWTRHLIEQMSGIYTGSVYCGVVKKTFKAECQHQKQRYTIVVKTHAHLEGKTQRFQRAVLILRNPYDALFAEYNRKKAGKTGTVSTSKLNSTGWNEWAFRVSRNWHHHALHWLTEFQGTVHILSYERLKTHFFQEMYNLASYLNVTLTYSDLWCLKENGEGSYHRKKKHDPIYSVDHRTQIDQMILEVKALAKVKYGVKLPF